MKHTSLSTHPTRPGCTWVLPWHGDHAWLRSQIFSPHPPESLVLAKREVKPQRTGVGFRVLAAPFRGDKSGLSLLDCAIFQQQYTLLYIILYLYTHIYKWHNVTAIHHTCARLCVSICVRTPIGLFTCQPPQGTERRCVPTQCEDRIWQDRGC